MNITIYTLSLSLSLSLSLYLSHTHTHTHTHTHIVWHVKWQVTLAKACRILCLACHTVSSNWNCRHFYTNRKGNAAKHQAPRWVINRAHSPKQLHIINSSLFALHFKTTKLHQFAVFGTLDQITVYMYGIRQKRTKLKSI